MCEDCPDPEACLQGVPCWKVKEVNERANVSAMREVDLEM